MIEELKEKLDKRHLKTKGQMIIENGCLNGLYEKSVLDLNNEILYIYYGMDRPLPISEEDLCNKKCWSKYFSKYKVTEFFFTLKR